MNIQEMNTVRYEQGPRQWSIRVEPDILIKLKRWFEKIPKGAQEIAELNDSPLNAFELLTFVQHLREGARPRHVGEVRSRCRLGPIHHDPREQG